MRIIVVLLLSACALMGQPHNKWFSASLVAQMAAHSADIATSVGGYEQNRLFMRADGKFSVSKGIAFKAAWVTGMIGISQTAWGKRHHRLCTAINFGQATIIGVVAIRNLRYRQ